MSDVGPTNGVEKGSELAAAVAFARLELLELLHGRRELTACPGVENVAKAIREAKAKNEGGIQSGIGG